MSDHGHAKKHPRLEELEAMVRDGQIDTLIVAITDMQGRLMGKRVQGQAFLDGVIDHGAHFCTYLLGTDMEMNTPDGFALMNWETGYGDWIAEPVWDTLRVLPWLEKTALVLSDTIDEETHQEIPGLAADHPQAPGRRGRRAGHGHQGRLGVRVLRPQGLVGGVAPRRAGRSPKRFGYYNEDYHLLQATKAEPLHRLLRNQMTEARIPIEFSKGEAAPGQHEVNIRYDHVLESADRSVIFKHGAKEIAYLNGWGITFMAKPDHRWTGSSGHLHMSIWDLEDGRRARCSTTGDRACPTACRDDALLRGRDDEAVARAGHLHRAERQLLQALRGAVLGAGQRGLGPRQPDDRLPGRRPRPRAPRRVPLPRRRHERLPDLRRDDRRRACTGSATASRYPPSSRATATWRPACDRMPRALYEAIRGLEASEAAVEIFGQDVVDHYLNAARVEQETYDAVVHPWDRERYLERS